MTAHHPDTANHAPANAPAAEPHGGTAEPALYIDNDDRYARLRLISWWRQERLQSARVLVVGAGALGNEVLKNLALLGLGTIDLVDFDRIEASNLSRSVLFREHDAGRPKAEVAALRAMELNPDVRVIPIHGDVISDVGLGLFAAADLVIGCLDNREARLWVNRQCWKTSKPWIDAGIQEIQGVVKVFTPPTSACYECAMTARDYQLLNLRYSCPQLPRESIHEGKVPTAPTIASMMAALEVQEALKILHGLPVAAGSAHVYNGLGNQFYTTKLPFRDDCLSHETYPAATPVPASSHDTAQRLFTLAAASLRGPHKLILERELATCRRCPSCGRNDAIIQPRRAMRPADLACPGCGREAHLEWTGEITPDSPLAELPLATLGIPPYDVVRIDGEESSGFFLLEGDRARVLQPGATP